MDYFWACLPALRFGQERSPQSPALHWACSRRWLPSPLLSCTCLYRSCKRMCSPFCLPSTSAWLQRTSTRRFSRFGFVKPLQREPGCTVSGNHLLAAIHEEEVMKKLAVVLFVAIVAVLLLAPGAFAQTAAEAAKPPINPTTLVIAVGFGEAVAAFG